MYNTNALILSLLALGNYVTMYVNTYFLTSYLTRKGYKVMGQFESRLQQEGLTIERDPSGLKLDKVKKYSR